jgi:hypothetical protein
MAKPNLEHIEALREELNQHPIYGDLKHLQDLQIFMAHHIFSVWDFMSLVKYLQNSIAPAHTPWLPASNRSACHFINQLVLEEESSPRDKVDGEDRYSSHFELYLDAMHEVGAERQTILGFLQKVRELGVEKALDTSSIPEPARRFTQTTFCIINEDKPHLAAAALALGRETIIPDMFRRFLQQMDISATQAPNFHDYLNRHVHLDENFHGPMSLRMLESLCDDAEKADNAEAAAEEAICARIRLWDGVHEAIKQNR